MKKKDKRRVAIYSRTFRPEPTAAALRLGALADALVALDAQVVIVTSTLSADLPEDPSLSERGYRVHRAPVLRDATGMVRGYVPYMSFDVPGFFRLLLMKKPHVIVCEPPPTSGVVVRLAAALRRIPYVYYAGDIVSDAAQAQRTHAAVVSVVRGMERWALSGAQRVITVGQGVVDRIQELTGRNADLVPNGIDTSRGPYSARKGQVHDFPLSDGPVFLYAGTVADWLAPEVFVDAFVTVKKEFPGARLVFLGQGSAWEDLQRRAADISGIVFFPSVSPDEAYAWYGQADVSLASLRPGAYHYAYPTKILASLAAGTPVIYAGPGTAAEDIRENDLGIATDLEVEEVARAMCLLAKDLRAGERYSPERLWRWVDSHRSARRSSHEAAQVVLEAAAGGT